ncbi:16S rRNA (uracil(1498)-N(3))-methyltransferase [Bacillus sp. SM2101]|uniref:16S rRNA (uracil(1498)-N(3))-methyltransferase n=1 Tax=Bacillus sp. SM2101 TaxID=2805366 RepID=UPI001BDE8265|nr:16S rRNA (uracil(1498)-N(3))-methyltransferase [Bacillus sp. SM2101]
MQRYFIDDKKYEQNDQIIITNDDHHHITRVMRMNVGDSIYVIVGQRTARCEIVEITNEEVLTNIVEWVESSNELPIKVTIASGLPKGDKLELVIQKGTELGANSFIPFNAARSIVKWDEQKGLKKIKRWQKIAKEAAEQSHRNKIPDIYDPMTFKKLLENSANYDYKLIAYEEEAKIGEQSVLAATLSKMVASQSLLVVFGPEGGLSEKEVEELRSHGFKSCALGPRILRTETAPIYLLSAVSYHFELSR